MSRPSRRAVLAGAGAVAALAPSPAMLAEASAAAEAEAALITACAAVRENERISLELTADREVADWTPDVRAEEERLCAEWDALMARIVETPAATPAGIRAKAALARDTIDRYADGTPMLHCRRDQLVWSLFEDLLGEEAR